MFERLFAAEWQFVWDSRQKLNKTALRRCWTQRTGKPFARLLLFSGFTTVASKPRLPALTLPEALGDEDQAKPLAPTLVKAPVSRLRLPVARSEPQSLV